MFEDVWRDTWVRYLGYANEVGEAFRPLIPRSIVKGTYMISIGYVFGDMIDKTQKKYNRTNSASKAVFTAGDVFLWQMFASVIIPGFTINRVTWLASTLIRSRAGPMKFAPTAIGLCTIPFIVHPIDHFVDAVMDSSYRKLA